MFCLKRIEARKVASAIVAIQNWHKSNNLKIMMMEHSEGRVEVRLAQLSAVTF